MFATKSQKLLMSKLQVSGFECVVDAMQARHVPDILRIEQAIYTHPWSDGNFKDSLNQGYPAHVVTSQDALIAYAVEMIVLDETHLLNLSVAKSYQRHGVGRALLKHLIFQAETRGQSKMVLEVRESNLTGIALYQSVNFERVGYRKNYYPSGLGREDAIIMELDF